MQPAAEAAPCTEDPVLAQLQRHEGQQPSAAPVGEGRWRGGRLAFLLSAALATGGSARADEVVPQSADWVVSVVFTLALVALALVTLGVRGLFVFESLQPVLWPPARVVKEQTEVECAVALPCAFIGCKVYRLSFKHVPLGTSCSSEGECLLDLQVVYLSFTSWRDKRIEKQDRERLVQSEKDR